MCRAPPGASPSRRWTSGTHPCWTSCRCRGWTCPWAWPKARTRTPPAVSRRSPAPSNPLEETSAWQAWAVATLRDLAEEHTGLGPADIDHLHRLAGDWQLLSDLSFADLLLWVPVRAAAGRPRSFLCVAQVRPTTAPTAYQDDQVGKIVSGPEVAHLGVAYAQGRIWREGDPVWYGDTPARHEAIPVRLRDESSREEGFSEVIAVIGRDTNLSTARTPSQLQLNYLTTADDLAQMVAD